MCKYIYLHFIYGSRSLMLVPERWCYVCSIYQMNFYIPAMAQKQLNTVININRTIRPTYILVKNKICFVLPSDGTNCPITDVPPKLFSAKLTSETMKLSSMTDPQLTHTVFPLAWSLSMSLPPQLGHTVALDIIFGQYEQRSTCRKYKQQTTFNICLKYQNLILKTDFFCWHCCWC